MKLRMKNEKVARECKATPLRVSLPLSLRVSLPLSLRAIAKQSPLSGSNSRLTLRYFLSLLFFIFLTSNFFILHFPFSILSSAYAANIQVTTNADSGAGSLREAITTANGNGVADTITFTISSATITLFSQLPLNDATGGTTIDGTGQNITIDGAGASFYGFEITSANNTIKGLMIINFSGAGYAGIHITGASATNNTISGNKIGNDGTTAYANYHGILIENGAPSNIIGGTTAEERNIISGNSSRGVYIGDANTNNNVVKGNYIGTDVSGTTDIPNNEGVLITSAQSNIIGGTTAGERNIISGNTNYGVFIINPNTNNNVVKGNYIGTDVSGTTDIPNDYGVYILNGAQSNIIGGTTAGERNIISGNTNYGVYISDANSNEVKGNYIGTDVNGTTALANSYGVALYYDVYGAQSNIIGGTGTGEGNLIAFNTNDGVWVDGDATDNNKISGNTTHTNGGLGIDLTPDGVTLNDSVGHTGPNQNLNFPVIISVVQTATDVYTVSGTAPAYATVELFRVDNTLTGVTPDGTGYGEAFLFLGSVTAGAGGDWSILGVNITGGSWITATATDTNNNTSEFAQNFDITPLSAPTGLTATAGDSQVTLSWTANTEPDLAGYNVYRSTTQAGTYTKINTALVTANSYIDTTVTNGTTYFYKITAVDNLENESARSYSINAIPSAGIVSSTNLDNIMSTAKLTEGVRISNITVDENALIANYSATKQGDYLVWEKPMTYFNPAISGSENWAPFPSGVTAKFALNKAGYLFVGAVGSDADCLGTIPHEIIKNNDNSDTDDSSWQHNGELGMTIHTTALFGALWSMYKELKTNSIITGGPANGIEFRNSQQIFQNKYTKPLYHFLSSIEIWDVSVYGNPPLYVRKRELWMPFANGDINGTATRSFNVNYTNALYSSTLSGALNDNSESSYVKWGEVTKISQTNWGYNEIKEYNQYPTAIELGGTKTWSQISPEFKAAVVADNVSFSNWSENPSEGPTKNPPPFLFKYEIGWNGIDIIPPVSPTGLSATPKDSAVDLIWNANTETDLDGYNVYRSTTDTGPYIKANGTLIVKPTTSYSDTGLTNGITYWYKITAVDISGNESDKSAFVSAISNINDTTPPTNITTVNDGTGADITYTTSTTQLSANWTASSDPESGIAKYWYAIGTTAGGTNVVGWTNNGLNLSVTKTDLTLTNGQIYYFTVKAENGAGLINQTPTSSNGQTVGTTIPTIDSLSSSTHPDQTKWYSNNKPSFSWTGSGGSSGLAGYYYLLDQTATQTNAYVQTNGAFTTSTSYTYTTAKADGVWYFHLIAKDNAGNLSLASNYTVKIDVSPPSNITTVNDGTGADITYTNSTTELSANWTASSDSQSGIVKYWCAIGTTAGGTEVVSWTDNGLSTSVTKTGLTLTNGQTYYWTVKAENGAGLINQTPTNSNGQTVVDTTSPLVLITSPLANASLTETVEIKGTASDAYLKEYRLEYGVGSNPTEWESLKIGESSVVSSVLYSWDTSLLSGIYTLRLRASDTSDNSQEVKVLVTIHNSSKLDYALLKATWRMISLPFTPENPEPAILFALSNLKLYYWDPTAKEDADYSRWRVPDKIVPGRAYWIRIPESADLNLTGSLVDQSEDFLVHLYSGWNQIGNPFVFDLDWGEVKVRYQGETVNLDTALSNNWAVNYIYWYENRGYSQATSPEGLLTPGSGYWFWSWKECELVVPPIQSAGKIKNHRLTQINTDSDWMLKIGARVGDYNDLDNYIGVGKDSLDEYDRYDAFEPPVLGDYVSLYFPHSDWGRYPGRYANDFRQRTDSPRSTEERGQVWEMVVETNLKNTQVSLSFEEVVPLPSGYQVRIVDLDTGQSVIVHSPQSIVHRGQQSSRAQEFYSYNSGSGGKRHFRIIVGKESEMGGGSDQPLSLQVHNFPNPDTTGNTTFKYNASPEINRVVIEVYNLAGRLVDRFEDLTPTDGTYEWPFGRRLANGVYIYRITVEDIYGRKASSTGKLAVLR